MTAVTPEAPAAERADPAPLDVEHVSAAYGPYRALFDVSFHVPAGTATALLGANGSGKTTVARVCSGLLTPTRGAVLVGGVDLAGLPTHKVARLGVAHAPEGRSVFASLTVEENLALPLRAALGGAGAKAAVARAYELFPRLGERRRQAAGSLSGGEQRMLSLARVLVDPPRLLVVDELSLGLAPIIVDEVYGRLAEIKAAGTTMLVIEQHVTAALGIADQVVVLGGGRVRYAGAPRPADELARYMLPGDDSA